MTIWDQSVGTDSHLRGKKRAPTSAQAGDTAVRWGENMCQWKAPTLWILGSPSLSTGGWREGWPTTIGNIKLQVCQWDWEKNINKSRRTDIEKWSSGNNLRRLKAQGRHMEVPWRGCVCPHRRHPCNKNLKKGKVTSNLERCHNAPKVSTWNWQMIGECPQWYKNQQATSEPDSVDWTEESWVCVC